MPFLLNAKLRIDFSSSDVRKLESIRKAISPEATSKGKCLLRTSLKKNENLAHLLLDFEASDLISLRASVNTNLRLLNSALKTLEVADEKHSFGSDFCC
jgi:tRNA threonylcarbamoyladenosine modification (KEOPS) complex  Pcc1 subunit